VFHVLRSIAGVQGSTMCGQVLKGKCIAACRTAAGLLYLRQRMMFVGFMCQQTDGVMAHGFSIESSSPAAWVGYPCCGKLLVWERRGVQIDMYCEKYRDCALVQYRSM